MPQSFSLRLEVLLKYGAVASLFAGVLVLITACSPEKAGLADVPPDAGEIFTVVEKQAGFPGGAQALTKFLQENLRYPAAAERANVEGKVFVSFVVNRNGSVSDVQILKGVGFGADEEAVRVVKAMPAWEPGRQSGEAVRSRFNLPIHFVLEDTEKSESPGDLYDPKQRTVDIVSKKGFKGTVLPRNRMPLILKDGKVYQIPENVTSLTVADFEFLPVEKAQAKYGTKYVLLLK